MHCYKPLKRLALNLVVPQLGGPPWTLLIDGKRYVIRMQSPRLKLFKKSRVCACCGIRGKFFCVECTRDSEDMITLNLYATGGYKNRYVTPLTMDHIIPRAQKGPTTMRNLQVLCTTCNNIKADKLLTIPKLQKLVKARAMKRVKQRQKQGKQFIWKNNLELEAYETVLYGAPLKGGLATDTSLIPIGA